MNDTALVSREYTGEPKPKICLLYTSDAADDPTLV